MKLKKPCFTVSVLVLFLGLISCENSLDPLDKETGLYSVYGALDLRAETNFIRVRELNTPFTEGGTGVIDAKVTFKALEDEEELELEGEAVEYFDLYHHNFEYAEQVRPNTPYRLKVERSDGASVSLEITTPSMPIPTTAPVNQKCNVPVTFELDPIEGSTVVIYIGYPKLVKKDQKITDDTEWRWGGKYVFAPSNNEQLRKVVFTFSPYDELRRILPFNSPFVICKEKLITGNIFLRYEHYGPGFYEELTKDTLDVMNTHRFGAFYYDTLAVPYDTLQSCGPECLED